MTEFQSPETLDRLVPSGALLPRRILAGFSPPAGDRGPPSPLGRESPPAPSSDEESPDEMEADGRELSPYASDEEEEVSPEENRYYCYRRRELSCWSPWCPRRRLICNPPLLPAPVREIVPSGVGAGLNNLGFTCFLNAVLQCLTHTVPLVQAIRAFDHDDPCDRGREGFCVLCTLREHIELCICSSGRIISPFKLVHNLNNISSDFQRYQQEDAHEFQQALLDRLERCCLDSKTEDESLSTRSNIVDHVFGGRLVSKLQCCSCGHCSCTYEPLIDLSLEIEHVDNLSAALESFTNVEKIEDPETKFRCSNCNQEVSMEKQLLLDEEPSIAVFHLKRFKSEGFNVEKIDKHLDFPLELDLQPYTGGRRDHNVEFKYQLYAIVVHIGISPTSGHYFSFVRSSPGTWHRFDDAEVQKVQEDLVLAQDAYLLFYTKQGTPWFSSLMEAQKPHLNPDLSDASPTSVLDNVDVPCTSSPGMADTDKPICCEPSRVYEDALSYPGYGSGNNGLGEVTGAVVATFPLFDHYLGKNEVVNTSGDDIAMFDAPLSSDERNCRGETSFSGRGEPTTSGVKVCEPETRGRLNNDGFRPLTPSRSPSPSPASPDAYARKLSGASDGNSHLLKPNRSTCKQQLSKVLDDPKRREALRYIRNMPSSRGLRFYNAVLGPRSPVASKKKIDRRRMRASPCKRTSPPSARPRSSHAHSVAARSR